MKEEFLISIINLDSNVFAVSVWNSYLGQWLAGLIDRVGWQRSEE